MCVFTVMSEEVTVHNVNQTLQLLLDQAARRNLQDELCVQLTVWRKKNRIENVRNARKNERKKGNMIR